MSVDFKPTEACIKDDRKNTNIFYFPSYFLDRELCNHYRAVYGFARRLDDLIDDNEGKPELQRAVIKEWKGKLLKAHKQGQSNDPILGPLIYSMKKYNIPLCYPLEFIEGSAMDIDKKEYNTFSELYRFCYCVVSAPGLMLAYGTGAKELSKVKEYVIQLGIAVQLTDILRDVREDAKMGRVYLPKDELARFGLSKDDILSFRKPPLFTDFVKFQIARARRFYKEAEPLNHVMMERKGARLASSLAFILHREVLNIIERNNYDIYQQARLSTLQKLLMAGRLVLFGFPTSETEHAKKTT